MISQVSVILSRDSATCPLEADHHRFGGRPSPPSQGVPLLEGTLNQTGSDTTPPPSETTKAGGTHPTGTLSCGDVSRVHLMELFCKIATKVKSFTL